MAPFSNIDQSCFPHRRRSFLIFLISLATQIRSRSLWWDTSYSNQSANMPRSEQTGRPPPTTRTVNIYNAVAAPAFGSTAANSVAQIGTFRFEKDAKLN